VTQEFNISVTPIGGDEYLVRTEWTPDVTAAEERVCWPVQEWLDQASLLMNDPLLGLLRGDAIATHPFATPNGGSDPGGGATSLVEFGQSLYNSLFQGMLRDSWMRAQGIAQHRREVLRLRLGLKDPRLPCLPWEVLHAGDRPLATGTDIAFSRYHTKSAPLVQSPAIALDEPLRILMVLAAPSDQERLALRQEATDLKSELESTIDRRGGQIPDIKVEILDQPDRAQLTQALEHQQYQVLHYAGHSNVGAAGGSLYLVNRTTGLTETLSGDDLAGLLVNNGIRMAVFNSCRGVYTATSYPPLQAGASYGEGNLAEALVKRGIPAVLAMAERIPDDVALNLSRLFYRNLRRAYPVDLSLNRARQGLVSSYGSHQLYWALPTLYMHPEFDGFLQPLVAQGEEEWTTPAPNWEPAAAPGHNRAAFALDLDNPFDAVSYGNEEDWLEPELPTGLRGGSADDPVAQLVQQLSQGLPSGESVYSPAPLEESLLPDPLAFPDRAPSLGAPSASSRPNPAMASGGAAISFAELEALLADTNRLTSAIAACLQSIQRDPSNAQSYRDLGQVLAEQGHLSEAIAAYGQALHLNPHDANVHNEMGMVQLRQGHVEDAMHSYSMAIHLNPGLMAAQHNLRLAKQRHSGVMGSVNNGAWQAGVLGDRPPSGTPGDGSLPDPTASAAAASGPRQTPAHQWEGIGQVGAERSQAGRQHAGWGTVRADQTGGSVWGRIGLGLLGFAVLMGAGWVVYAHMRPSVPTVGPSASPAVVQSPGADAAGQPLEDPARLSTNDAIAKATQLLRRGDMAAAQPVIEALLDRNATAAASTVLKPVLGPQGDNPTINFLMGRLAWQARIAGDKTYSVDDARRYWARAVQLQPNPTSGNALGFAYYEEGNLDRAGQTWLQVLKQLENSDAAAQASNAQAQLTAYAGMALVLAKTADQGPSKDKASKLAEAVKLRQKVMTDGALPFSSEALAKNWLWSEKAMRDWQALQSR
jgi:tetratricopeptide (TPR) repeat protein